MDMAVKRILVLSPLPAELVRSLISAVVASDDHGEYEVRSFEGANREEFLEEVAGADIIVGDYSFHIGMDAEAMRAAAPCLLIQQPSVGYQHLDVEEAARQGIPVANAAGANAVAVAEHTILGALACLKKLILQNEKTQRAEWAQDEMAGHGVFELCGKVLGIVGMGRIGREVAARACVFGCSIVYYDVVRLPSEDERELGVSFLDLDELLASADVVSLHAPLTEETANLLDARRINLMKSTAVLVNVARGEVVDERALASALRENRLGGAVVDVYVDEPIRPDNPLIGAPNTILTPHTAGASNESRLRIITASLLNVVKALKGEKLDNVVNEVGT
jgi:glyoxylate reductase